VLKHLARKLLLLSALVVVPGLTACDSSQDPAVVEPALTPQMSQAPNGWHAGSKEELKALEKLEKERIKQEKELRREERKALKQQFDDYKKSGLLPKSRIGSSLLICEPQDYDAETAIIGPDGGEIKVGEHKLVIPPKALSDWTLITMEAPPSLLVEVKFTPHGVHFDKQPMLKLSYNRCYVPHDHPFRIVYIDDAANILEWPVSFDLKHWGDVFAWIDHFSKYAVASN
jgi:hypothetical protein